MSIVQDRCLYNSLSPSLLQSSVLSPFPPLAWLATSLTSAQAEEESGQGIGGAAGAGVREV